MEPELVYTSSKRSTRRLRGLTVGNSPPQPKDAPIAQETTEGAAAQDGRSNAVTSDAEGWKRSGEEAAAATQTRGEAQDRSCEAGRGR